MASWFKGAAPARIEDVSSENEVPHELSTKGKYGLEVCHDGDQAVADIIFVHGLTGNRQNTWTSKTENVFWPKELLSRTLPNTRIMTYGYDADIAHFVGTVSHNRIGEHAGNLVNAVTEVRESSDTEHRPIIFVAHSLGGLVTEDALLYSKNSAEPHLQDMVQSVVGICFLGTPHCGSDLALWGSVVGNLAKFIKNVNVDIVNVLKTDSEVLARVQREFHTMLRGPSFETRPPLKITCFFEELPVGGAGFIVPKHSAILSSYNAIGIHADHSGMTKFGDANDPGYRSVSGELRRWVKELSRRVAEAPPPSHSARPYGSPFPDGRDAGRYQQHGDPRYEEDVRGYGYGGPQRQPPYADDGYGRHRDGPNRLDPHYGGDDWRHGRRASPQPSPQPPTEPLGYQNPDYMRRARSPSYQQYRAQGGYSSPPPPPVPRFIDEPEPQPGYVHSPMHPSYQELSPQPRSLLPEPPRPSPVPQGNYYHSTTHAGGMTFNGVNFNGNASF